MRSFNATLSLALLIMVSFGCKKKEEAQNQPPAANQTARGVRELIIHKKKPVASFKQSQIWIHSHQAIYNIKLYHPERDLLRFRKDRVRSQRQGDSEAVRRQGSSALHVSVPLKLWLTSRLLCSKKSSSAGTRLWLT